jgi:methionyl-tRNA formyltransferase
MAMRLLMMGTGSFAVPTFRGLLRSSHDVVALITRPVRTAQGRRTAGSANPMRDLAQQEGIAVHAPDSIKSPEAIEILSHYGPDLHVVCDYGQILSRAALATARLGGINLHGSLLPRYRGAAPINWALYEGALETGVTVIHMTARLDAGPCLVQRRTIVDPAEDAVQLEQRLAVLGSKAVSEALEQLEHWDERSPLGTVQQSGLATHAPRLKKTDGAIDWARGAQQIFDQVRALQPWPGTYTYWQRPEGKGPLRLLLTQVAVEADSGQSLPPGTVVQAEADRLVIACGQGRLRLLEVQPAGKKRLTIREFLRGYPLASNDCLQPTAE